MKRNRQQKTCHCAAYAFPHRHDVRRCIVEQDEGDDYAADHRADDPRKGQAAGLNRLIRRPQNDQS